VKTTLPAVTALAAMVMAAGGPSGLAAQDKPTFTAAARLVPISVMVRDENGKPVVGLQQEDFEVLSDDQVKPISHFKSEPSPITVALLMDRSGSMKLPMLAAGASDAAHHLISWMSTTTDRIGVFGFDMESTQTSPFGLVSADALKSLDKLPPYGTTSLYDALDATSKTLQADASPRRAVVAITDGVDTASTLKPAEVAARAAMIDVPVYIIAVAPLSDAAKESMGEVVSGPRSALDQLTDATGGQTFYASAPHEASKAARSIVTDLRQQYLIAFAPDPRPGWHRLTVRTKQHHKSVRARAGYVTR
jgi:VWFA-related protein